jgi:hypothetical protein
MVKFFSVFIWLILHPVHVTLTSIDHVPGTDSLKVFIRMYYDDFLSDYKLLFISDSAIDSVNQDKLFPEEQMSNYLNEKVKISVNNKQLKGKLLNMDLKDNEISLNLLYKTDVNPQVVKVRNLIMTQLYADQANMTIVHFNDFEEGVKLTPDNTEQTFSLK